MPRSYPLTHRVDQWGARRSAATWGFDWLRAAGEPTGASPIRNGLQRVMLGIDAGEADIVRGG
ncbi:MAG TPA: hypothetical protein VLJ17_10715, partial [Xanthobacteraceae bacterium]|nr:hypothetical protein [Xanthobacteraceae bacterium]